MTQKARPEARVLLVWLVGGLRQAIITKHGAQGTLPRSHNGRMRYYELTKLAHNFMS